MIKCELLVGGYAYDVTDDLVNWDDVEMKWKRQDLDGVVRSFTTKFEFAGGGYSLLTKEYLQNYLNASASVVFYTRNNSWLWNERFRCALDFSTFSYNGRTCEINAIDDSLAALIKAKNGTQYEYSVDVLKEDSLFRYDRLGMQNKVEWVMPGNYGENNSVTYIKLRNGGGVVPMYISSSEIAVKNIVEVYDSTENGIFIKNLSPKTLYIDIEGGFSIDYGSENAAVPESELFFMGNAVLRRVVDRGETTQTADNAWESERIFLEFTSSPMEVSINAKGIELPANGDLSLQLQMSTGTTVDVEVSNPKTFSIGFSSMGSSIDIPVVTPQKLLNRILKSMNGGQDGLTGTIESDARLDNTVLLAAESIRGMKNAKLYTSFNKFKEWMSAEFGFVPVIGEKSVSFVHRSSLFTDETVKVLEDVTDFELSVDAGNIYSRVNVGYDKVDYESVNGKDEFRFTQQYTTGVNVVDGSLDLTSPYRADAYGMEFLAAKRGEDTTDSESDNDVFMVGVTLNGSVYTLDRSVSIEGTINPETMFNGMYAHDSMIAANEGYLGVFSEMLEFASSDGNSDVVIDGVALNSDVAIGERLFTVGVMNVTTGDTEIPADLSGVVEFSVNGKVYKGYVNEITLNIGRSESVTYKLIVKSIE